MGEQLTLLTSAISASAGEINKVPRVPVTGEPVEIEGLSAAKVVKRQLIAVGALLALIIVEIFATVGAAIAILGLAGLLIFINPVTSALVESKATATRTVLNSLHNQPERLRLAVREKLA